MKIFHHRVFYFYYHDCNKRIKTKNKKLLTNLLKKKELEENIEMLILFIKIMLWWSI